METPPRSEDREKIIEALIERKNAAFPRYTELYGEPEPESNLDLVHYAVWEEARTGRDREGVQKDLESLIALLERAIAGDRDGAEKEFAAFVEAYKSEGGRGI